MAPTFPQEERRGGGGAALPPTPGLLCPPVLGCNIRCCLVGCLHAAPALSRCLPVRALPRTPSVVAILSGQTVRRRFVNAKNLVCGLMLPQLAAITNLRAYCAAVAVWQHYAHVAAERCATVSRRRRSFVGYPLCQGSLLVRHFPP
jgi:hypothetical protein